MGKNERKKKVQIRKQKKKNFTFCKYTRSVWKFAEERKISS